MSYCVLIFKIEVLQIAGTLFDTTRLESELYLCAKIGQNLYLQAVMPTLQ